MGFRCGRAAALGAAALAAVGTGIWEDFSKIDEIHQTEAVAIPRAAENAIYEKLLPVYKKLSGHLAEVGDMLTKI